MTKLNLLTLSDGADLVAPRVLTALRSHALARFAAEVAVAEINPAMMGGDDFCKTYDVPPEAGANCVVLEAKRADKTWYVVTLVPVGYRTDIGGYVRRLVNARKTSVAPLQIVLSLSGMEYGSITPVGLPDDWTILVDSTLVGRERVFIGSGLARSKLMVPGELLGSERFTVVPGLAIEGPRTESQ